jgi:hypothetical protein
MAEHIPPQRVIDTHGHIARRYGADALYSGVSHAHSCDKTDGSG